MLRVVLASNNRGKLVEMTALLAPYQVQVLPLAQFTTSRRETATLSRNALLKHGMLAVRIAAIADDSA